MRIVYKLIYRLITSPQRCQRQWRKIYDRIAIILAWGTQQEQTADFKNH